MRLHRHVIRFRPRSPQPPSSTKFLCTAPQFTTKKRLLKSLFIYIILVFSIFFSFIPSSILQMWPVPCLTSDARPTLPTHILFTVLSHHPVSTSSASPCLPEWRLVDARSVVPPRCAVPAESLLEPTASCAIFSRVSLWLTTAPVRVSPCITLSSFLARMSVRIGMDRIAPTRSISNIYHRFRLCLFSHNLLSVTPGDSRTTPRK